ncbi:MAG: adenylate kinase family protein [Candidatus Hadarchaeales archaeon]
MVIAVTGTPGTGKTVFAEKLSGELNAGLIRINDLIEKRKIYELDRDGTKIVEVKALKRELKKEISKFEGTVIVEGHMSHFMQAATHVVVLRTSPEVLINRLESRGYSARKVMENVEAEALDIILWEAVKEHGIKKVFEIDTTGKKVDECVRIFLSALKRKSKLKPGRISWLEKYLNMQNSSELKKCKIKNTKEKK